jgi:hypothetical protein
VDKKDNFAMAILLKDSEIDNTLQENARNTLASKGQRSQGCPKCKLHTGTKDTRKTEGFLIVDYAVFSKP